MADVTQSFDLSDATANALELPSLLEVLAHLAATDLGRERLEGLRPFGDEDALRAHRRRYEEAERLVAAGPLVASLEEPVRPLLDEIRRGGYDLRGRDVVRLGDLLRIVSDARRRLEDVDPPCPALAERVAPVEDLGEIEQAIRRTFDARGEVRENASPRLTELRGRIRGSRQRLYDELSTIVDTHREHFSEDTIPRRGGRLVLVLQAGSRGKVPGLVHGRSGTGKSFYFEPLETVELNNQLQQAVEDEEEEKRRILNELISRLRRALPELDAHAELVADLDRLQASVRFAQVGEGRLAELGPRHAMRLVGARHPLLDPRLGPLREEALGQVGNQNEIIALDLELDENQRILVVTGPNAGGKTVAMKTLGLLALAHQCGLPLPAASGTRLPFLGAVVATVGDEQDLLADRSTFSGRLLRLKEAWESAGPDALILLDELGSGTDPEEGAALAVALLENLLERRSLTMITTHLSQLAIAALESDGAICAAMQFDSRTGAPTYRLLPGPPGGSEALALGRRLGLPSAWLERAEALLGDEHRDLRRILAELEETRDHLARTQVEFEIELGDAARLRERLATREAELVAERKTVGKAMQQELQTFKDTTQKRLREEVEKIRRKLEKSSGRRGVVGETVEELFKQAPEMLPEVDNDAPLTLGGRVRHRGLGWEGILEKLDRGRAEVHVRGKIFRCKEGELVALAKDAEEPKTTKPKARGIRLSAVSAPEASGAARELKLIGLRVEPALHDLDRFLDQALLAAYGEVRVVHGHGSGRLREAVREHLRRHPAVASQRPGKDNEGGNGATIVDLALG